MHVGDHHALAGKTDEIHQQHAEQRDPAQDIEFLDSLLRADRPGQATVFLMRHAVPHAEDCPSPAVLASLCQRRGFQLPDMMSLISRIRPR